MRLLFFSCAVVYLLQPVGLLAASFRTQNFTVTAPNRRMAREFCQAAEHRRSELAKKWLGEELPDWSQPCSIRVKPDAQAAPQGMTSYAFRHGQPHDCEMVLSGESSVLLESVLPHEVMHTILATYYGRPIARWIDEGICTVIESPTEREKHDRLVRRMLGRSRPMRLTHLFAAEDYPRDVTSFYMQSYSVTHYLVKRGGPQKLLEFVDDADQSEDWEAALRRHYGFASIAQLEQTWQRSLLAR